MQGHSPFDAWNHQILDAHVRERTARHHPIIAATRAVAVEVFRFHAMLDQISPGWRIFFDRTGGTDVICRHRIAEDRQRTCAANVANLRAIAFEERRLLNVCRIRIPFVQQPRRRGNLIPEWILIRKIRVKPPISGGIDRALHHVANLFHRRPDFTKVNMLTILAAADRLLRHVDVHAAGQRERHHERRRHQEICADRLMHARFEVAIAAQHRRADEIVLRDRVFDERIERP